MCDSLNTDRAEETFIEDEYVDAIQCLYNASHTKYIRQKNK